MLVKVGLQVTFEYFNGTPKNIMRDRAIVKWLDNGVEIEEELVFGDSDDSESGAEEICTPPQLEEEQVTIDDVENQMIQICMHDCLEKLAILKCINQKTAGTFLVGPTKDDFPVYKTVEERFGDAVNYETDKLSEDTKRYNDISTIYSILYKTLEDLTYKKHYDSLLEGTAILKRLTKEEDELLANEANSSQMVNELRLKLDTQSKSLDNKYRDKLEELRKLELEYEDAIGYGHLEIKYIESWETARRHQGQLVLSNIENSFLDTVSNCDLKSNQENKIHEDIVSYIEENSTDMQNEIQYWMDRFDVEIEARDSELLRLRIERENQMDKFIELKDSYEERKLFIEYWDKILLGRKQAAELLAKQTRAATKIQAWWRGIMFRRKLGPYSKKRKGKGKDKKGKGGKGAKGKKKK